MRAFHEVRSYDADFMVWHTLYSNISFLAHWHKEIELIYVRKGTLEINLTNLYFVAKEGDFIFCDSGEIHHSYSSEANNTVDFIVFDSAILSPSYLTSRFTNPLVSKELLKQYGIEQLCRELFNTVIYELNHKGPYYQDIIKTSIQKFWFVLKRHLPRTAHSTLPNKHLNTLSEFQQLLSYIESHYQEKISLEDAAQRLYLSPCHFSKTFNSLMGIPFVSYVNMVRIEHAVNLLQKSSTVIETGLSCGFNNIRTFNRVFKQITGYTPSDFLRLPDIEAYRISYSKHKSNDPHIVENDSTMMIRYIRNESTPIPMENAPDVIGRL
jgi:AraC-like DNA-binding protein